MVNTNDRPNLLNVEHVMRLLGTLDPLSIVSAFEAVCSELVGSCAAGVFTFFPDDQTRVLRFGGEGDPRPVPAPNLSPAGTLGSAALIEGMPPENGTGWRAHLPIGNADDSIGVVQITLDQPVEGAGVDLLKDLARVLAIAVRNSQTFERTRRLTFTDDLTALYNSRFMALYLDRELKRCRRTRLPLSLLFMDLDGFKKINDTHGHLAGSKTLTEVGAVLEQTVRDADVLIRYGGDEFVILFPETPLSGALIIAERIRQVIEGTKFLESQRIVARVSASIGIAAYPESADDVRGLISSADQAMYRAKSLGKNRVIAASPLGRPESPKRS